ncbi:ABC transporter ATP-binding protein [Oscillibacter valericigenes]|nr:ABC transporter ATP-binding protein [Oscillibacter valericigenes]
MAVARGGLGFFYDDLLTRHLHHVSVVIDGIPVSRLSRNQLALQVAYVAQKNELARSTVFDAVLLGRKPHMKWGPSAVDYDEAEHALRAVGMEECRLRYVDQLSGGEQQKVILARAIAQEPKLLLLDEPTSSLDLRNQYESMDLIRHCAHDHNIAVLVVIHDLNLKAHFHSYTRCTSYKKHFSRYFLPCRSASIIASYTKSGVTLNGIRDSTVPSVARINAPEPGVKSY